jgi:DNA-binding MarR family transcriptional regulator
MADNGSDFGGRGIRSLVNDVLSALDKRYTEMRKGTRYEKSRQFDGRVFVAATREGLTESEIAREFGVTRQAIHASVDRLVAIKLLERQAIDGNRRDKQLVLTERGMHASQTANAQIASIEAECSAILGEEDYRKLRRSLELIANSIGEKPDVKPPV